MRYCRFCGTQVPDDSIFCPRCGKALAMPETTKAKFRVSGEPSPIPSAPPKSSNQKNAQSPNQRIAQSSNEEGEPKKKSSLWGCTIFFVIFTVACVLGVFIYNSFFTGRENPLIPKDDTIAAAVVEEKETAEPVTEKPSETVEVMDGESLLQRRVQKIYDDVLFNSNRKGCVQQYCTDDLKVLISKAEATGEPAAAIELPDGRIVTGKTSDLLGPLAAALLNALKTLGNIDQSFNLVSRLAIEPIQKLKTAYLGSSNPRLHTDEILIALSSSAAHNE